MFILKKVISAFITLPGLIIIVLLLTALFQRRLKTWKAVTALAVIIYLISITPVSNYLISTIEKRGVYRGTPRADVIILLGGGYVKGVEDLTGDSILPADMLFRVVETARLYKRYKIPIIFTGGSIEPGCIESKTVRRFLVELGVKPEHITLEDQSLDTMENAAFVKALMKKTSYKKAVLVTSSYHMKRSELIFKRYGFDIVLHSAGASYGKMDHLNFMNLLPDSYELLKTSIALRETIGYYFYRVKFAVLN